MSIDECRKAFEGYILRENANAVLGRHPDRPDEYVWHLMHNRWIEWQECWIAIEKLRTEVDLEDGWNAVTAALDNGISDKEALKILAEGWGLKCK